MCTISWFYEQSGYNVFFNRDEQVKRARAKPPEVFSHDGCEVLMPIDPDGGGSWLSTNSHGVTLALLNYYQGRVPKGKLKSRGQLIKKLSIADSRAAVNRGLAAVNLQKYAPFSLLMFEPRDRATGGVPMLRWTGRQLLEAYQQSPLISSAKLYERVLESRLACYKQEIAEPANVEAFYQLHRSHTPEASALSVCMHREDANTVSFSHVQVMPQESYFHYFDGHPCSQPQPKTAWLKSDK